MKKQVVKKTLVNIKIEKEISQQIKTLASFEKQTMQDWVKWMVTKAYEAKVISNQKTRRSLPS